MMRPLSLLLSATAMVAPATAARADATDRAQVAQATRDRVTIQTTGNVTFDLDSDEIFDLHGSGTLLVSERAEGITRTLRAQGSAVAYTVDGATRPYDEEAKDWLRGVLAEAPTPPTPPPTP